MLSTPAMNVVATAPSPGVSIPSRPVAGAIDLGASPEDDLEGNFFLRCNYGCARREAAIPAVLGGAAGALGDGESLTMRIGLASIFFVARYT